VPVNKTDIAASLTITGFDEFEYPPASTTMVPGTGSSIIITAAPTVTFAPIGSPAITGFALTAPTSFPVAIGVTGKIAFKFTSHDEGKYKVTFDIPVAGFSTAASAAGTVPVVWHIKGGIASGLDFTGTGSENAAALMVIDPDALSGIKVTTNP